MQWQEQIDRFTTLGIDPVIIERFNQRFQITEAEFESLYNTCTRLDILDLKIENEWQLLCLLGNINLLEKHLAKIVETSESWKTEAVHYLALSGSISVFKWMKQAQSEKLWSLKFILANSIKSKDGRGYTILHYAAASGSINAIKYVLEHYPELIPCKTNKGSNFILCTALSGSVEALRYVCSLYPESRYLTNNKGANLLHCAAMSGSVSAIEFILAIYPELKEKNDLDGNNFIHYVCFSRSIPAINFVLNEYPELRDIRNFQGHNILHIVSSIGSVGGVQLILKKYPELKDTVDNIGANFLHCAAMGGSVTVMQYILDTYPQLKESKGNGKVNFAFYTMYSNSLSAVQYVLNTYPEFQYSTDSEGNTILHHALISSEEIIVYILEYNPKRIQTLLGPNLLGLTPDILRLGQGITKSVTQILNELIHKKLEKIVITNDANDILFVKSVTSQTRQYLLSDNFSDTNLLKNIINSNLHKTIFFDQETHLELELKVLSFEIKHTLLTKNKLQSILSLIEKNGLLSNLPTEALCKILISNIGPYVPYSRFVMNFRLFVSCIENRDLSKEEIITLKVIIDDYKRDFVQSKKFLSNIINVLEKTTQIWQLPPRLPETALFDELMESYIEEYESCIQIMRGLPARLTSTLDDAANFILERHELIPANVYKYLKEVIGYKEKIECVSDENRFYYYLYAAQKGAKQYIEYQSEYLRPPHGAGGIIRAYGIFYCTRIEKLIPLLEKSAKEGGNFPHSLNTFLQKNLIEFLPEEQKNNLPFFAYRRMEVIISAVKSSLPVIENNSIRNTPRMG